MQRAPRNAALARNLYAGRSEKKWQWSPYAGVPSRPKPELLDVHQRYAGNAAVARLLHADDRAPDLDETVQEAPEAALANAYAMRESEEHDDYAVPVNAYAMRVSEDDDNAAPANAYAMRDVEDNGGVADEEDGDEYYDDEDSDDGYYDEDEDEDEAAAAPRPPVLSDLSFVQDPKQVDLLSLNALTVRAAHLGEERGTTEHRKLINLLLKGNLASDMKKHNKSALDDMTTEEFLAKPELTRAALKTAWGWTDEQVDRHFNFNKAAKGKARVRGFGDELRAMRNLERTMRNQALPADQQEELEALKGSGLRVNYSKGDSDRAPYAAVPGPTIQAASGAPLDTGRMASKFGGPGFGIYVVDSVGNLYVGGHQVGLFHHSSFTAGQAVRAAGEMKVSNGKLVAISNKSGHYQPKPQHLRYVLEMMHANGVDLNGVRATVFFGLGLPTVDCDAEDFRTNWLGAKILRAGA